MNSFTSIFQVLIFQKDVFFKNFLKLPELFLNPLTPNVPFLYPLKTSENHTFSDAFRKYKLGKLDINGLTHFNPMFHLWKSQVAGL